MSMVRGRASEFVLLEEVRIFKGFSEPITLPPGSFIKPINFCYIPKHIIEDDDWKYYKNSQTHIFCYTKYGILPIERKRIREL